MTKNVNGVLASWLASHMYTVIQPMQHPSVHGTFLIKLFRQKPSHQNLKDDLVILITLVHKRATVSCVFRVIPVFPVSPVI